LGSYCPGLICLCFPSIFSFGALYYPGRPKLPASLRRSFCVPPPPRRVRALLLAPFHPVLLDQAPRLLSFSLHLFFSTGDHVLIITYLRPASHLLIDWVFLFGITNPGPLTDTLVYGSGRPGVEWSLPDSRFFFFSKDCDGYVTADCVLLYSSPTFVIKNRFAKPHPLIRGHFFLPTISRAPVAVESRLPALSRLMPPSDPTSARSGLLSPIFVPSGPLPLRPSSARPMFSLRESSI